MQPRKENPEVHAMLVQVGEILGQMDAHGLPDAERIAILEEFDPAADNAGAWFLALEIWMGSHACGPALRRWLESKRPSAASARKDWQPGTSPAAAAAAPGPAASSAGPASGWIAAAPGERWQESLAASIDLLERGETAGLEGAAAWLPGLADKAGCAGLLDALARLRAGLRLALHARLAGRPPSGRFNLLVIDAPAGDRQSVFERLLDAGGFRRLQGLDPAPLHILWIEGNAAQYATGEGLHAAPFPDPWRALALLGGHASWDAGRLAANDWIVPGEPTEAAFDPARANALEASALSALELLPQLARLGLAYPASGDPASDRLVQIIRSGASDYARSGVSPPESYQAMIALYGATRGYSNDFLSLLLSLYRPARPLPAGGGILGRLSDRDVDDVVGSIRRKGFHVFDTRLPEPACELLTRLARTSEARLNPQRPGRPERAVYDPASPLAEQYLMLEEELLPDPAVQGLIADPSLLAVSSAYLGAAPILDMITMWWSTSISREASTEVAQLYHFDMDRPKWLKWFVYLTDVDADGGPHCFVAGTHRRNSKPEALLRHGYARIADSEVASRFPAEDMREIHGRRGTILAVDTRGFHKGKVPVGRTRLIFELEFANSLFGAEYRREARIRAGTHPALASQVRRLPEIYRKYL